MHTIKQLCITMTSDGTISRSIASTPSDMASTVITFSMPPETNDEQAAALLRQIASELEG